MMKSMDPITISQRMVKSVSSITMTQSSGYNRSLVYINPVRVTVRYRCTVSASLVVLSALVAVALAAPRPGLLHAAPGALAYSAPLLTHSIVPTAVSHQSRVDVHSSPVISTTYAAAPIVAAPAVHAYAAPALAYNALPTALSHSSRVDLHRSAALIATPVVAHGLALAAPLAHGYAGAVPALHAW
ncbi:hypothetical protein CBL_11894 [Carabus blaptoides fortunei]